MNQTNSASGKVCVGESHELAIGLSPLQQPAGVMITAFLAGMVIGAFAALFPGPINLEVIRRAVGRGPRIGGAFGLGAVTADAILATAASHGAAALFSSLPNWGRAALGIASSVIIMIIGLSALQAKIKPPPPVSASASRPGSTPDDISLLKNLLRNYFLGLFITLSSPSTITFWLFAASVYAKFLEEQPDFRMSLVLGAGVAVSCLAWVLGAVTIAGRYHRRLEPKTYLALERIVGIALLLIAGYSLLKSLKLLMVG